MESTTSELSFCRNDFPTLNELAQELHFKHTNKAVDIGSKRCRILAFRFDSLSLITFEPMPGTKFECQNTRSVTLGRNTVKNLYDKLEIINDKIQELTRDELKENYRIYLGERFYLTIFPEFECIALCKHYRPAYWKEMIVPGIPCFYFNMKEFSNFYKEFAEIEKVMSLSKLECTCNPDLVCNEENCNNCKMPSCVI